MIHFEMMGKIMITLRITGGDQGLQMGCCGIRNQVQVEMEMGFVRDAPLSKVDIRFTSN